jgi:hypothetical protein
VEFDFFFTRKVILRKNAIATVLMPGGFGTMDEIFEILTLLQTGKLPPRPLVCMGSPYWKHMRSFIRETMLGSGAISPEDLDLMLVTDDVAEAIAHIKDRLAAIQPPREESQDIY